MNNDVQAHYNTILAESYSWINGGMEDQVRKNQKFFSSHGITPHDNSVAIDIGGGCGFQSVALAMLGFSVTAVDFCQPLLDRLRTHAGALPIVTIQSDVRNFSSWAAGTRHSLSAWVTRSPTRLPCGKETR
ncbi:MAG: class I SAM-dependent methyltransferase [Methanoregula sp.]